MGALHLKPHIVLTRPAVQATRFAEVLAKALGNRASIVVSPLLQINPLDFGAVPDNRDVIFTSINGVTGFVAGGGAGERKAFCVGDKTAQAARAAGFEALSAGGTSADLIGLIASEGGGEMIYARGAHVARDLSADLAAIGIPVSEVLVYSQDPLELSPEVKKLLQGVTPLIFPLFSKRSMELLGAQEIGGVSVNMSAVCISEGVADAAPEGCFDRIAVCDSPNGRSMIESLQSLVA
jgi:uroporphyrinogen-III synthase